MPAELGAAGGWHGFEACWQIWPADAFPLEMPFTVHMTVASDVLATVGTRVTRWPVRTDADDGETLTVTLLTIVAEADATSAPAVA